MTPKSKAQNLRNFAHAHDSGSYTDQWAAGEALACAILIDGGHDPATAVALMSETTQRAFTLYCATR